MSKLFFFFFCGVTAWFFEEPSKTTVHWPLNLWPVAENILELHQAGNPVKCRVSWRMRIGDTEVVCPPDANYQPPSIAEAEAIAASHPEWLKRWEKQRRYRNNVPEEVRTVLLALWNRNLTEPMQWEQIVDSL